MFWFDPVRGATSTMAPTEKYSATFGRLLMFTWLVSRHCTTRKRVFFSVLQIRPLPMAMAVDRSSAALPVCLLSLKAAADGKAKRIKHRALLATS